MTDQDQPQHAVYAGVPTGQNPYFVQTENRSLSQRQKRGAAWAGIVGFNILSFGWALVVIPLVFALFGAIAAAVMTQVRRSSAGLGQGFQQFYNFVDSLNFGLLLIPALLMVVLGLILMAAAILLSRVILKAHSVKRPAAVTWAGAGVAIVASWFVSWLPGLIAQPIGGLMMSNNSGTLGTVAVTGALFALLSIAITSVVGWLSWWWMAHVFRGAPVQNPTVPDPTTPV